jgi:hypothetical protein
MAGKGMKSLSEALRGLSLAAQPCRTLPVCCHFLDALWTSQLMVDVLLSGPASFHGVQEINGDRSGHQASQHHTIRQ